MLILLVSARPLAFTDREPARNTNCLRSTRFHFFVAAGGLIAYGADRADIFGLAASYVDRILRGDTPADLPVAPTKFETSVNLRTAKALGLPIPPGLLVAADEVIE